MADIWQSIRQCRVVLAELTGKNPNVLYELGLAHAVGRPAIIITRDEADVPFDLRALRYVYYDTNNPFWGENLRATLTELLNTILAKKEFGSGLDGIKLSASSVMPEKPEVLPKPAPPAPIYDVSGSWELIYERKG